VSALAYFITFHTYGTWLHGNEKGSVDRSHNRHGEEFIPPDPSLESRRQHLMKQAEYRLDAPRRAIVLKAILEHASHKHWSVLAIHVRSTHVHLVVNASAAAERVMVECKAYASRALNQAALDPPDCQRWSRHGSTRHLFTEDEVAEKIHYVVEEQGDAMELFVKRDDGQRACGFAS
jgi:REP element-mobilizing transposase RayT